MKTEKLPYQNLQSVHEFLPRLSSNKRNAAEHGHFWRGRRKTSAEGVSGLAMIHRKKEAVTNVGSITQMSKVTNESLLKSLMGIVVWEVSSVWAKWATSCRGELEGGTSACGWEVEDADGFSGLHPAPANRKFCNSTTARLEVIFCYRAPYIGQPKIAAPCLGAVW